MSLDSFYKAFISGKRYLMYLDGLKMTILVSVLAILLGVALGTVLALMRLTAEKKGKSTVFFQMRRMLFLRKLSFRRIYDGGMAVLSRAGNGLSKRRALF